MRVAVLGAAGLMGAEVARDLGEDPGLDLVLLDRRRAPGVNSVDAADRQALTLALDGCALLVNCASYRVNLAAMDAALAARANYLDLGGLFHVTERQLALDPLWRDDGLVALLGCGAGPGRTNLMAALAAEQLDEVRAVRCASAGLDEVGPSLPYARETLLDELREPPQALRDGRREALAPLASGGPVEFAAPIGVRETLFTLHSEVLTLGDSLGATCVDFRLGLHPDVERALRDDAPLGPPSARTWSAQRVDVEGVRDGRRTQVVVHAVTPPDETRGVGGGIVATAGTAAAIVRLFAQGALGGATGVLPPERALTPQPVFALAAARGTTTTIEPQQGVPA